jgi:hypothetical protein
MLRQQYGREVEQSAPMVGLSQRLVGSYQNYADAERAVDYLADQRFPVERAVIVGRGLHSVERITGRLGYLTAAGRYAVGGAIIGALFGWFFGVFDAIDPLVSGLMLALWGALFGAVIGAVFGLLAHAMTAGLRDFSSVQTIRADTYHLLVDADVAEDAARRLDQGRPQPERGSGGTDPASPAAEHPAPASPGIRRASPRTDAQRS